MNGSKTGGGGEDDEASHIFILFFFVLKILFTVAFNTHYPTSECSGNKTAPTTADIVFTVVRVESSLQIAGPSTVATLLSLITSPTAAGTFCSAGTPSP
jgi:hypothetical protein